MTALKLESDQDPWYDYHVDHPLIAKLQVLTALPDADRALLSRMLDDVRTIDRGEDIAVDGDRPDHVSLVVSGWACRYKVVAESERQITALLLPGDFCDAHVTLLRQMDHSIGALTIARVAFIHRDMMVQLFDRPVIARALWWASLVDEGVLRAWIVNLARRDALQRVAHLFCELQARLRHVGKATDDRFLCPLTRIDLGDLLCLEPVQINLVLRRLRDAGLLTFRQGAVAIQDLNQLQHVAGFDPRYLHLRG